MEYSINFVGIEGTPSMREEAKKMVEGKIKNFKPLVSSVIFNVEKEGDDYKCKIVMECKHNEHHETIILEKRNKDYYKSVNLLGEDIKRRVRKFKEKTLTK